jgi:hypothetical protein
MKGCAYFRRKLSYPIEPKMGPGAILETLEDCTKFMGHMHRWRQTRPHWEHATQHQLSLPSKLRRPWASVISRGSLSGCRGNPTSNRHGPQVLAEPTLLIGLPHSKSRLFRRGNGGRLPSRLAGGG